MNFSHFVSRFHDLGYVWGLLLRLLRSSVPFPAGKLSKRPTVPQLHTQNALHGSNLGGDFLLVMNMLEAHFYIGPGKDKVYNMYIGDGREFRRTWFSSRFKSKFCDQSGVKRRERERAGGRRMPKHHSFICIEHQIRKPFGYPFLNVSSVRISTIDSRIDWISIKNLPNG